MEIKPPDVILALMQFLEILLPGALVSFFLKNYAGAQIFGTSILPKPEGDAQGWVVFFFASYLLGHLIFLVASFLDGIAYDTVRRRWKPVTKDSTFQVANGIKIRHLGDERAEIVNTYQWAKANLNLKYPSATGEIKRHESDSKFFRSLVVVFIGFGLFQLAHGAYLNALGFLILAGLSFWRYFDQRWKSTQIAYIHLIAMEDVGYHVAHPVE